MHDVGEQELDDESGHNVAEKDDAFGDQGTNKVKGCRQDDYIEDIVDKT